ncbi:MAG: non-ribosomal peptide synthetase, partial [Ktedonobacteraceae bacterium]|nr:non-ribosomal peptide synthetase [Ktedonobacteraceae bacterium]
MSTSDQHPANLSTAEKRALLEQILRKKVSKPKSYPLSYAQQRFWFLDQWEPGSSFYNVPLALKLTGTLHIAALERSFNAIVQRHSVLRATFAMEHGQPVQIIAPRLTLSLPVVDLSGTSCSPDDENEIAQDLALQRSIALEGQKAFDLQHGPLIRTTLVRLSTHEHVLLLTMHHIVSDIWSMRLLFHEVAVLYEAYATGKEAHLPELPIQYTDFASWQRQWLEKPAKEGRSPQEIQLAYWQEQLAGVPPVLDLPTDHPRPVVQTFRGAHHVFTLPVSLSRQMQALSRQERVTPFMILLAAFQVLLARYSSQADIVVGTPVTNRTRTELENVIGCFVNTLVLRAQFSDRLTVRELLQQVRDTTLGAHAHQDLPFEKLVEVLHLDRDQSRNPLFQVMFILQNAAQEAVDLAGLTLQPLAMETGTVKFDMSLMISESETGLEGELGYNLDLFEPATIERLLRHFQTLLHGLVQNVEQRVADLPLLNAPE